jgi:putative ABC transport system permease protein
MSGLWQDLKLAVRMLAVHRAFTILVVATLALGIGANSAIFSAINGLFLRPLPYQHAREMFMVEQPALKLGTADNGFSVMEVQDYRSQVPSLASADEYHSMTFTLYGQGEPTRVISGVVSASYFDDLGVHTVIGRSFLPGEDAVGAPPNAILSHKFWQSKFGGDPHVIGQTFTMNDKVHTIIGVLPPLPDFPDGNEIYIPAGSCPFRSAPAMMNNRAMRMVSMFVRVKPGTPIAAAEADLRRVSGRMHAEFPAAYPEESGLALRTTGLGEQLTRQARPTLLALLAMTGFLLLIACANVANLTLARHIRRSRETAMRVALGATRGRLLRQLTTESVLLALIGGGIGIALANAGLGLLRQLVGRFTPRTDDITIDGTVLGFTLVISVVTGLLFGALPALPERRQIGAMLRDGGRTASAGARGSLRALLVITQVAVACVLLVAAGLLARTLVNLRSVDTGFDASHVVTALVPLNWSKYTDSSSTKRFAEGLLGQLRGAPGVGAVGLASALPLDGQPAARNLIKIDQPGTTASRMAQAEIKTIDGEYFAAIGSAVLQGRAFTDADRDQNVVMVNQSGARAMWPGVDAIGRRITADSGKHWFTIVGVAKDVRQHDLTSDVGPVVYVPFARNPQTTILVLVRSVQPAAATEKLIRGAVQTIDAQQPITDVRTLESLRTATLASPQLTTTLSLSFAVVALLLTAAGLTGVMAFSVGQRTQELGIRLALGAERNEVLMMVVREGMVLVAVGLLIGMGVALAVTRGLKGLLFGVGPLDTPTYLLVMAAVSTVTLVACLVPARRATTIDPLKTLRTS